MSRIFKFSQLYDPAEDRIAIDTETTAGETQRLWLTQRMCRGLVEGIAPMLKAASASDAPPEHEAVIQSWEQAAAVAELGKVPPVRPSVETKVGLVREIQLAASPDGVVASLDYGGPKAAVLALKTIEARQFLAMLHTLFSAARWPGDIWPAWIGAVADGPAAAKAGAIN